MKLTTKAEIAGLVLAPNVQDAVFFDDDVPGFGIRLRVGGSRNWIFQYKIGSKHRRLTLGPVTVIDPAKARNTAKDLYAKVRLGQDPQGEKAHGRILAAQTFEATTTAYLAWQQRKLRKTSLQRMRNVLENQAKPLHRLRLDKITRRDIATCVNVVTTKSGPSAGNRCRSMLSGLFSWCVGEGLIESNPVIGVNRNQEKARERVLNFDELRLIWNALPPNQYGTIVKLLLLTGSRAAEIGGLHWGEVQSDRILLPSHRTKNGREHVVPLSGLAVTILAEQPKREGRDLIFGNRTGGFSGWSKAKRQLDADIIKATKKSLPPWCVHDLRRSVATHMAEIGVQPHIVEAVLNHVSGHKAGVAGTYNRAAYEPEKRTALDRWASHLIGKIEGRQDNVRPLRA